MQNFLSFGNEAPAHDDGQEHAGPTKRVLANGTWQSIVGWGRTKRLDPEQQIAFEILTSTYVLTFIDKAISSDEQNSVFFHQSDALKRFARRRPDETRPLRLFVTSPAGAGKCKYVEHCLC